MSAPAKPMIWELRKCWELVFPIFPAVRQTELRISEVGSAAPPIPIQIKDFTSMNYLTSEKTVTAGLGPGNIVVTIKQY